MRSTYVPSVFGSDTLSKSILCSVQRASISLMYSCSLHVSTKTQRCACLRSKAFAHSRRPRARPSWISAFLSTYKESSPCQQADRTPRDEITHLLQGILDAHTTSLGRGGFRLFNLFYFTDISGSLFDV
jgi:hypothetical protein